LFKILIDTCVWLDLAKDYQQQPILTALEELIRMGDIELILPRTVLDEFARNKGRVVEESSRSLWLILTVEMSLGTPFSVMRIVPFASCFTLILGSPAAISRNAVRGDEAVPEAVLKGGKPGKTPIGVASSRESD
jgi:PIN domain